MDVTSELAVESAFESVIVTEILAQDEAPVSVEHAEINARRAQIENPEMLRHLRSL